MKCKIRIRTPNGQATGTAKKLKPFIIGIRKINVTQETNKDDNEITWYIDADIRDIKRITRNVALYDRIIHNIFNHRLMKKTIMRNLKKEQLKELKQMLADQTTIEVIETTL